MRTFLLTLLPLLAIEAAACGGNVNVGGAAGTGGTNDSSGASGSSGDLACPTTEPSGQACDVASVRCTYGDSVRPDCRDDWTCLNGVWTTTKSVCAMFTTCPAAQPAETSDCSDESEVCAYGNTLCECNACTGGPCMQTPKWQCSSPPSSPCPAAVPNDGSACPQEGLQCNYGHPCGISGASVMCKDGAWLWVAIPCPA